MYNIGPAGRSQRVTRPSARDMSWILRLETRKSPILTRKDPFGGHIVKFSKLPVLATRSTHQTQNYVRNEVCRYKTALGAPVASPATIDPSRAGREVPAVSLQISWLIQFSRTWAVRNPPKNEEHSGIDCAALPAPGVMRFTEARGMMMIPSRVHLDFPKILELYSLGTICTVWKCLYSFAWTFAIF